ncbi:MAG: glycosyltransferase family 2 protein, partial [Candidatus Baltobacteraceae bacterium]
IAEYFSLHQHGGYEFNYLIVDDGSRDETYALAQTFARWRKGVRVLHHERNRGLGAALRTAIAEIDSDLAVVLDADLSYSPATAMELIETLEREHADIALASPYARGGCVRNVPLLRRVLSSEANRLLSLATSGRYATLTCMVRAYRVSALRQLEFRNDGMEAIPEMLLFALRQRMSVVEIPAALVWSDERRAAGGGRLRCSKLAARVTHTFLMACRHRPTLWLAVPGLFPGLLPLVIAILLIMRVSGPTLAIGTTATIVIQYSSLAFFGGQLTAFIGRRFSNRHRLNGVKTNGYNVPSRTA